MLEIDFNLLNERNEFMILVPIRCAAEDIERSTVYTALSINTYKVKSLNTKVSRL